MTRRIVIVGASLAGLRVAQALRRDGHTGPIVLIGDEPEVPYDRPPLSKQLLTGALVPAALDLPLGGLHADWITGVPAAALDHPTRTVHLADGTAVGYDALVLTTGAAARPWPVREAPADPAAVPLTLRSRADSRHLADVLRPGRSLLIVGAGFLGSEVAAAARARGLRVVLVEGQPLPLAGVLGPEVGRWVAGLHCRAGVDLRLDVGVAALLPDPTSTQDARPAAGAELSDGTLVHADAVLAALGAVPNTAWLSGSGLQIDGGVITDAWCRPLLSDGRPAQDLVAAGDVTRWPHPFAPGQLLNLGHWSHATEQADAAAATLLHGTHAPGYRPVPSFWSDLHGRRLRSVGLPHLATSSRVTETDRDGEPAVVLYHQGEDLIGAVTIDRASRLGSLRAELADRLRQRAPAA